MGNLIGGLCDCFPVSSAYGAESLALLAGMNFAQQRTFLNVVFEIDCKDLHMTLQDDTRVYGLLSQLLRICRF